MSFNSRLKLCAYGLLLATLYTPGAPLAQRPELFIQRDHTAVSLSVALSPDGKLVATGGDDNAVKLWEVATGKQLRDFPGAAAPVTSVSFSPDGKILIADSLGERTHWQVSSGKEIVRLPHGAGLAYSPDGRLSAVAAKGWPVSVWDLTRDKQLTSFSGSAPVAFSSDGRVLASLSHGGDIILRAVPSWRILHTIRAALTDLDSVTFSPNRKLIAARQWGPNQTTRVFLVGTKKEVGSFPNDVFAGFSFDDGLIIRDTAGGKVEVRYAGRGRPTRSFAGKLLRVSPGGDVLVMSNASQRVQLLDLATGRGRLLTEELRVSVLNSAELTADKRLLVIRNERGNATSVSLWDVSGPGKKLYTLVGSTGYESALVGKSWPVVKVAFDTESHALLVTDVLSYTRRWDLRAGTGGDELRGDARPAGEAAGAEVYSPDKRYSATAEGDEIRLRDLTGGRELPRLSHGGNTLVGALAFSPDGKILASAANRLWWGGAAGQRLEVIKLWEVGSWREITTFAGHTDGIKSVAFSPDGKILASGGWDAAVKLWDVTERIELATLISLNQRGWAVVTPGGLFDGSPAAWKQILWRFSPELRDTLVVESFFNEFYHPGLLAELVSGQRPGPPPGVDLTTLDRRQPHVEILAPGGEAAPGFKVSARTVRVKVKVTEAAAGGGARDVRLFRNGILVKAWRGDVLRGEGGCTPDGRGAAACETTVSIVAGRNHFTAYAFNRHNIKSADESLELDGDRSLAHKGTLYVLAVGIDRYENPDYDLLFAVADAKKFSEELSRQQTERLPPELRLYAKVEVIPLHDSRAKKDDILTALRGVAATAQPEDAVVLFFAGHGKALGVDDPARAARGRFYLIPHDMGYRGPRVKLEGAALDEVRNHSISDRELEQEFERIDASKILLVVDACNSGEALESEEWRRGPMNSRGLAQLAYEKGMYVLTASQGYQAARESSRFGHGLLTYALVVEGLEEGLADTEPRDGQVLLREWLDYATRRVPELQSEKEADCRKLRADIECPSSDKQELVKQLVVQQERQRPRVFYRREDMTGPLVIGVQASGRQ